MIVVVATSEQVTKYEFGNKDVVFFMNLNWDSFAIVVYTNKPLRFIDLNLKEIHFAISLVVVRCVYKDLVEDFVEGRNILDFLIGELKIGRTQYPLL